MLVEHLKIELARPPVTVRGSASVRNRAFATVSHVVSHRVCKISNGSNTHSSNQHIRSGEIDFIDQYNNIF